MRNEIAQPSDDNLVCPEVGSWTEDKHRVVSLYTTMFSKGMKAKWGKRAYVEFYAGAAYSRIRGTQKIILGSPMGSFYSAQSLCFFEFAAFLSS
jgi:hypothetical protein